MNVTVRQRTARQRLAIVDCDIHPAFRAPTDLHPFLSARWREHMTTFGEHVRHGLTGQLPYPRMMAAGMRADAFPEQGPPGSDLELMRRAASRRQRRRDRHADAAEPRRHGGAQSRFRGGARARGERLADRRPGCSRSRGCAPASWCRRRTRPSPSQEIEERASDPAFVQILLSPRSSDPLGHRRYWPIYRGGRARRPADRPACAGLQRRPRLDRLGLADLLHAGTLRDVRQHAGDRCQPGVRRRVRALPRPEDRADRGRLCLGAGARAGGWTSIGSACARKRRR